MSYWYVFFMASYTQHTFWYNFHNRENTENGKLKQIALQIQFKQIRKINLYHNFNVFLDWLYFTIRDGASLRHIA